MEICVNLLLIALCVVIVIDISGIIDDIEEGYAIKVYEDGEYEVAVLEKRAVNLVDGEDNIVLLESTKLFYK